MAKMRNGILDGLNGAIGPVVTYQWKGRDCLRAREVARNDPHTPKQHACRRTFGVASRLASAMLPAASIGFRLPAEEGQTTESGCFMHANSECFSIVDGEVHVDYPTIKVAQGPLPAVAFWLPQVDDDLTVSLPFEAESGRPRDYVLLFAYAPALGHGQLALPVYRRQELVVTTLPTAWRGHEVHLYGFCWDNDQQASPSSYVGRLTL